MSIGFGLMIIFGVLATEQAPPPAESVCARARTAAPTLARCAATPHGAILSADAAEAARLAALATAGEQRFRQAFSAEPAPYVVVQGEVPAAEHAALEAAGFRVRLPWFTRSGFQSGMEAAVRRQVEAQTAGRTPEQVRAATDQALAQVRARMGSGGMDRDPQVVPHELGHGWYVQAFWPGTAVDGQGHYGGPGPDWLDETAAVLMEPQAAADERREQFRKAYAGEDGLSVDDLATFLHRDHPMKGANDAARQAALRARGNGPGLMVLRSDQGDPEFQRTRQAGMFYAQGRVFADFMIERTGRPQIFAEIGRGFGRGLSIEQWLAANGRRYGLGATVAELDRSWRTWLAARYAVPPAAPSAS